MNVTERKSGDVAKLRQLIRKHRDAEQRDRYRVVLLAIQGREAIDIADAVARSRRFVQRWAYAYRDGGIAAVATKPRPGRASFLTESQRRSLVERVERGATAADAVSVLRGTDFQKWIKSQFGKTYSLSGIYNLLHSLGYESLSPRPRHPKNDPKAGKPFRQSAPFLSSD